MLQLVEPKCVFVEMDLQRLAALRESCPAKSMGHTADVQGHGQSAGNRGKTDEGLLAASVVLQYTSAMKLRARKGQGGDAAGLRLGEESREYWAGAGPYLFGKGKHRKPAKTARCGKSLLHGCRNFIHSLISGDFVYKLVMRQNVLGCSVFRPGRKRNPLLSVAALVELFTFLGDAFGPKWYDDSRSHCVRGTEERFSLFSRQTPFDDSGVPRYE